MRSSPFHAWLWAFTLVAFGSLPHGQAQIVEWTEGPGEAPKRPGTSVKQVYQILGETIEMKDFQNEMSLQEVLEKLEKILQQRKKRVWLRVDTEAFAMEREAFKKDGSDCPEVLETRIMFQPYPKRMLLETCLRLALSKVIRHNATYRIRRGQIVITTLERAQRNALRESAHGNFKNVSLAKIFDELSEVAGVTILVDSRIDGKAQTQLTLRFGDAFGYAGITLETALKMLSDMMQLAYVPVGNAVYITSRANAPLFTKDYLRMKRIHARLMEKAPVSGSEIVPWWHDYEREIAEAVFETKSLLQMVESCNYWGNIVVDRRVRAQAGKPLTARFVNGVTLETALAVVTDMAGLAYVPVGDALYITSPANAGLLEKEERKKEKRNTNPANKIEASASIANGLDPKLKKLVAQIAEASSPAEAARGNVKLFKGADRKVLRQLKTVPEHGVALRAAWEEVLVEGLTKYEEGEMRVKPAAAARFLGFVEGRLRIQLPSWWAKAVAEACLGGNHKVCPGDPDDTLPYDWSEYLGGSLGLIPTNIRIREKQGRLWLVLVYREKNLRRAVFDEAFGFPRKQQGFWHRQRNLPRRKCFSNQTERHRLTTIDIARFP